MNQNAEDLWPEDIASPPDAKAPLAILREQAAALARKTSNLVEAEVNTTSDLDGGLLLHFTLVAPALSDYRYDLFTAVQGAGLYPIKLIFEDQTYVVPTEESLKRYLRNVFASQTARKVIGGLVAQSQT